MDFAVRRVVVACLVALACAACASSERISASGVLLTSGASLQGGRRSPVHSFGQEDFVWQLVDFKWADLDAVGGTHRVTWNWYQGDRLVSKTPQKYVQFTHSPFTLETHRAAATLGTGHFHVETVVDGELMATSQFDIHA